MADARFSNQLSLCIAFGIITAVLMVANAKAQDAEPKLYTNTPAKLNFLIAGYVYFQGKMAFDPETSSPTHSFTTIPRS